MKFKHLNAAFLGLVLSASSFVNVANAGIISKENTNTEFSIGSFADLQGLEWLSLDVTLELSRTNVENGFIGNDNFAYSYSANANRQNDSWRYATNEEVDSLINSLTYNLPNYDPKRVTVDQFKAANWFNQNFGYVSHDITHYDYYYNSSFQFGLKETLSNNVVVNNVGSITTFNVKNGYSVGNGYQGTFPSGDIARIRGYSSLGVVNFNNSNSPTGSLLVRNIQVPEPSTLAIFALGMIGLASRRFKKQS